MKKKSLKETNPFLKNSKAYHDALIQTVISSSAIEGIRISKENLINLPKTLKHQKQ